MLLAKLAQDGKSHIADAHSRPCLGGKRALVRVTVQGQHRPVRLKCSLESRTAEEWEDRLRFTHNRVFDRRVVGDADFLFRLALSEAVIELDRFAFRYFDNGLDSLLAKGHQLVGRKPSAKPLRSRKADSIHLKTVAIKEMNACPAQHAAELVLVSTFVIMVAKHCDHGNVYMLKHAEDDLHLVRDAVISEVAGDDQRVSQIVDR